MEENKRIVKFNPDIIKKVDIKVAITNKLLANNTHIDFIVWWNNLEIFWQNLFRRHLKIKKRKLELKYLKSKHPELCKTVGRFTLEDEQELISLENYIDKENEINLKVINILIKSNNLIIDSREMFELGDFSFLNFFTDLEELQFNNVKIDNVDNLIKFRKIKKIKFYNCKISQFEIDKLNLSTRQKNYQIDF
jgi:hypothetical protein